MSKKTLIDSFKDRVHEVKQRVEATAQRVADARVPIIDGPARNGTAIREARPGAPPVVHEEPPVIARMVVEIRSDGSHTIARGALEDVVSGERVAIDASGGTPIQLAASLASSLLSTPFTLTRAAGALVRNRLKR